MLFYTVQQLGQHNLTTKLTGRCVILVPNPPFRFYTKKIPPRFWANKF